MKSIALFADIMVLSWCSIVLEVAIPHCDGARVVERNQVYYYVHHKEATTTTRIVIGSRNMISIENLYIELILEV